VRCNTNMQSPVTAFWPTQIILSGSVISVKLGPLMLAAPNAVG
jgi:hypothetical protein